MHLSTFWVILKIDKIGNFMKDDQKTEQVKKVVEAKLAELSEYCDAVQIMATWSSPENPSNTYSCFKGFGN